MKKTNYEAIQNMQKEQMVLLFSRWCDQMPESVRQRICCACWQGYPDGRCRRKGEEGKRLNCKYSKEDLINMWLDMLPDEYVE